MKPITLPPHGGIKSVLLALAAATPIVHAAEFNWNVANGDYAEAANWTPEGGPPDDAGDEIDVAIIGNGGTATWNEGPLDAELRVGSGGAGSMIIEDGTFIASNTTWIGENSGEGNVGTLTIAEGASFFRDGGNTLIGAGDTSPSEGALIVESGGLFTHNSPDTFIVGDGANGESFTGTLTVNGGTVDTTGAELWVGQAAGGNGTLNLNGGSVTVDNWLVFGREGASGDMNLDGGTIAKTGGGNVIIGDGGGATSTVVHSEGEFDISSGELWIGQAGGVADYTLSGGTININSWLAIGRSGAEGTLDMSGGTINKTGDDSHITMASGDDGVANVNQSGGELLTNGTNIYMGEDFEGTGGTATWNLSGNAQLTTNQLVLGQGGTSQATFNLDGGTLTASQISSSSTGETRAFNFNGGELVVGADQEAFLEGIGAANIGSGGAIIDTNGFSATIAQNLLDAGGGLTKNGAGTLSLTGTESTYTGTTQVNEGTLNLSASENGGGGGSLDLSDGTTLGVTTPVRDDQLAVADATLGDNTTINFDLGGDVGTPQPTDPIVDVAGELTANGTTTINYTETAPVTGQFTLIEFDSMSGSGSFQLGELPDGVVAELVTTGNTVDLNITQADDLLWDGIESNVWNTSTENWFNNYTELAVTYSDGAAVTFDDTAQGEAPSDVTLNTTVEPSSVLFNNEGDTTANGLAYTLSGSGSISGSTGLTKQGAGPVEISTTNDYTGVTRVGGGTLTVDTLTDGGVASPIGAATADPANLVFSGGGRLGYTGAATAIDRGFTVGEGGGGFELTNDLTVSGPFTAAGGDFLKDGDGTLTLTNDAANQLTAAGRVNHIDGGLVFQGSGGQVVGASGGFHVGTVPGAEADLVVDNSELDIGTWLAVARGNSDTDNPDAVSTATFTNSTVTSQNVSLGFDNGQEDYQGVFEVSLVDSSYTVGTEEADDDAVNLGESNGASGSMTLSGSSNFTSRARVLMAQSADATFDLTISDDSTFDSVSAYTSVGQVGTATATLEDNAAWTSVQDFNIADVGGSTGTLNVNGDSSLTSTGNFFVGKQGTGVLNVSDNGVVNANGDLGVTVGDAATGDGTVNLNSGATLATTQIRTNTPDAGSAFNINGGTLRAAEGAERAFFGGLGSANILINGAILDTNGGDIVVAQPLLEDGESTGGGLLKEGAGALYLDGANTYTGSTTVADGTLGGNGTVAGDVTVNPDAGLAFGVTNPGGEAGTDWSTLQIDGTLTVPDPLVIKIDSTGAADPFPETGASGLAVATASGGISGFNAGSVTFDLSDFAGTGTWSASQSGDSIVLDYNAGDPANDYDAWLADYPGLSDNDPAADPDGDGLTNEEEYAFGLNPTSGGSANPYVATLDPATGTFSYTRRRPALTGWTYSYESSATLGDDWAGFTPDDESSDDGDPIETITVTVPASILEDDAHFIRVEAVE